MASEAHEDYKKLGVTHEIRNKLNFRDERLWKRFSARRLELIDTLDLSSKKASEQEDEIRNVAEALRIEFNYSPDYFKDFDRLVRAAVQSVRRNRKRSSKSKKNTEKSSTYQDFKRHKLSEYSHIQPIDPSIIPSVSPLNNINHGTLVSSSVWNEPVDSSSLLKTSNETADTDFNIGKQRNKFLSEILRLNSDSQDDIFDLNYSRKKHFSTHDKSRDAIDSIIKPRIGTESSFPRQTTFLPPISNLDIKSPISSTERCNPTAKLTILNYMERSKTCSESTSKKTENLEALGNSVIAACIAYIFEKSFENAKESSVEYLRKKLNQESYLARFFRDLDPKNTASLTDDIAVLSLYTLLGGCIKDFGFEPIMFPLCELFYLAILKDYPLISKSSVPFNSSAYLKPNAIAKNHIYSDSLKSLAEVASDIQLQEQSSSSESPSTSQSSLQRPISPTLNKIVKEETNKKQVTLRFLSSVLEFSYPVKNSAPPRFIELIENARSAFKLSTMNESILGLKNMKDGSIINSDFDLEKIFRIQETIELEIFTQRSKSIPIYEITSAVIPSKYNDDSPKIILPPPYNNKTQLAHQMGGVLEPLNNNNGSTAFKFLSNSEDITPPPLLPKFQPLL